MDDGLLKFGRVVGIHPEDMSIDVLLWDGMGQLTGVEVLFQSATTDAGEVWSLDPGLSDADKWDAQATPKREITACVGQMGGGFWVCVGFRYPQITQLAFERPDEYIRRYASGLYQRVDKPGTSETVHPSGSFVVFGADRDPDSLAGEDFDEKWSIPVSGNGGYRVEVKAAGAFKARFRIRPDNSMLLENVVGSKVLMQGGTISATAPDRINATAPTIAMLASAQVTATTPVLDASEDVRVGNGATGSFTTPTGQIVTVVDGIVVNIF